MIWLGALYLAFVVGVPLYCVVDHLAGIRRALEAANAIAVGYRPARDDLPEAVVIHLPSKRGEG